MLAKSLSSAFFISTTLFQVQAAVWWPQLREEVKNITTHSWSPECRKATQNCPHTHQGEMGRQGQGMAAIVSMVVMMPDKPAY